MSGRKRATRGARLARGVLGMIATLAVILAAGAASHLILSPLLRVGSARFAGLLAPALQGVLTFLIVGGVVGTLGYLLSRRKEQDFFTPLIDAMKRIASGEFSVRVPVADDHRSPLGPVASGLNDMALALKKMEEMRQEFIANVSHEIQSPLTSITGFVKALEDTEVSETERRHYLSIIESESKRLSRLSDDLLRLTALDAPRPALSPERFSLTRQLREVILAYEPQWQAKSITFELSLEEVNIEADRDMLHRVWSNLIHNAIKFSPEGGAIKVGLKQAGNEIRAILRDEGIGVEASALPYLFDRFYKSDRSRTNRGGEGGSGLGLAIVKRIVELHGGDVSAQSPGRGKGALFTVTLPAAGS